MERGKKMKFKFKDENNIRILDDNDKEVGQIFTPAGTANKNKNCIQICGFSEAFDLWGCGPFDGFKDIQLLFDGEKMKGKTHFDFHEGCMRCYRKPCQCEQPIDKNPFIVKREKDLKDRIIK